jgi:tRNA pseudouridine55 synthase
MLPSSTMTRKPAPAAFDGALVVNKPGGRTSHDVVDAVRRLLGFRQIGHLGTLDPLATGVLVLLLGRATRFAQFYAGRRKRYQSTFRFGFATDTYDSDGTAQGPNTAPALDRQQIEQLAQRFVGRFAQMPPAFSAKKIHGRPAHELARKQKPVELKPVEVEVFDFRLLEIDGSRAHFAIECGPGTYVRSLAYDLGVQLGCGAHVAEITRTAVGEFTLDQAIGLDDFEHAAQAGKAAEWIVPLACLLSELPRASVLPVVERRVRNGSTFQVSLAQIQPGRAETPQGAPAQLDSSDWKPGRLRVFNQQDQLIAIAEAIVPRTYQPVLVLGVES